MQINVQNNYLDCTAKQSLTKNKIDIIIKYKHN